VVAAGGLKVVEGEEGTESGGREEVGSMKGRE